MSSVVRDTGALVSTRTYDSYGAQTGGIVASASYDDPEIGYNSQSGYITDAETGLVLCGHRYYDPANGRWLNRDPIGYSGGVNVYGYCGNNPVMGVDTSGFDGDACASEQDSNPFKDLLPIIAQGMGSLGLYKPPGSTQGWRRLSGRLQGLPMVAAYFRGGPMEVGPNDVKLNADGNVRTSHGVSV